MASIVKIKRSSVQGKRPTTDDLQQGELALNTRDGKLFSSDGSSVFEVGANTTSIKAGTITVGNTDPLAGQSTYTLPLTRGTAGQVMTVDSTDPSQLIFDTIESDAVLPDDSYADDLGYTETTIGISSLFGLTSNRIEQGADMGTLDAEETDAFGVVTSGVTIYDCMEPVRRMVVIDCEPLS